MQCHTLHGLQLLPSVPHGWLMHELNEEAIRAAQGVGITQMCPRANVLTPEGVQAAMQAGMSVRAWGVRDKQVRHHIYLHACSIACTMSLCLAPMHGAEHAAVKRWTSNTHSCLHSFASTLLPSICLDATDNQFHDMPREPSVSPGTALTSVGKLLRG